MIEEVAGKDLSTEHSNFVDFHEGYVRHHITLADTKATIMLSLATTLLTYLFGRPHFRSLVFHPASNGSSALAIVAIVLLGCSAACSILVIAPRLSRSGPGVIFFGAVAAHSSSEQFLEEVRGLSGNQLTAARIQHSYDISRVCTRKYKMLERAIWVGFLGLAAALPTLAVT